MKIFQLHIEGYMRAWAGHKSYKIDLRSNEVFANQARAEMYMATFKAEWAKHVDIDNEEVVELDFDDRGAPEAPLQIFDIPVVLGRDEYLANHACAKERGPTATLACAQCGAARWKHPTRPDTCGRFQWVTLQTVTTEQIEQLEAMPGITAQTALACSRALNRGYMVGSPAADANMNDAKLDCCAVINRAKAEHFSE
jgi:hypothetical protein